MFSRLCEDHGLQKQQAHLKKHLLTCVGFNFVPLIDNDRGSSRLGGGPDLPEPFRWPRTKDRPLDFIMQINLREVRAHTTEKFLPSGGHLMFFYDQERQPAGFDPNDLESHAVCFFPDGAKLRRRATPHREYTLSKRSIEFWPAASLPSGGSKAFERLRAEIEADGIDFDADAIETFAEKVFRAQCIGTEGTVHRLGGHPLSLQGDDLQLQAQLVTSGIHCGDASGYSHPMAAEPAKTREEWSLLSQLDTDEAAGLEWGDAGMLYYLARRPDIVRSDFSRTWATMQSC